MQGWIGHYFGNKLRALSGLYEGIGEADTLVGPGRTLLELGFRVDTQVEGCQSPRLKSAWGLGFPKTI